jgi:hypothetical protein
MNNKVPIELSIIEWNLVNTALTSFARMIPKSKKSNMDLKVELIAGEIMVQLQKHNREFLEGVFFGGRK